MTTNNKSKKILSSDAEASVSLIVARIVYGINWFNISAIFPFIALEFGKDVSLLGSISAAFFIGVGLFQIPAGIFAATFNPRISAILGIIITSAAALLSGLVSSSSQLIWLRFIVGFGMAFFFSSAIILIARYGKRGFPGFSIGVMNSAHSLGGIIGIFAWINIAQIVGWRSSLILSGVLGLGTALLMITTIPRTKIPVNAASETDHKSFPPTRKGQKFKISGASRVLSNRTLVCLGLILIGIQAGWAVELTFLVVYLGDLEFSVQVIGIIASLPLIFAIISAPLIGRFYDKARDTKRVLIICGMGTSMAIAGLSIDNLYAIITSVILTGFFSGGAFTIVYEKARTVLIDGVIDHKKDTTFSNPKTDKQNSSERKPPLDNSSYFDTLKVAWVNGMSLIGVLWTPIAFSFVVEEGSYELAWIFSAAITAIFVITPIKFLK
ncbi:MAG TPA: MFS transporter [Nitrososphaera sp.]|nr:MFS transporter [Nitrososphaera sp.]